MCTAVLYKNFFGRNLDWTETFGEKIIITPRFYPLSFRKTKAPENCYAAIGTGIISENYPLYFDAVNEKGLGAAGLNFPGNAHYFPEKNGFINVAPFEFIPFILSNCANINEARCLMEKINLCNIPFSSTFGPSPLHFMVADKNGALTFEQTEEGSKIYENKVSVLTNNPPFDMQLFYLSNFLNVTASEAENRFSHKIKLCPVSWGMGAFSLPGDYSSSSRFVKAAFTLLNSPENGNISDFFHILSSVSQIKGSVKTQNGLEYTLYSSCADLESGTYYYKTYENSRVSAVQMHSENLDTKDLISYPLLKEQDIFHL